MIGPIHSMIGMDWGLNGWDHHHIAPIPVGSVFSPKSIGIDWAIVSATTTISSCMIEINSSYDGIG